LLGTPGNPETSFKKKLLQLVCEVIERIRGNMKTYTPFILNTALFHKKKRIVHFDFMLTLTFTALAVYLTGTVHNWSRIHSDYKEQSCSLSFGCILLNSAGCSFGQGVDCNSGWTVLHRHHNWAQQNKGIISMIM